MFHDKNSSMAKDSWEIRFPSLDSATDIRTLKALRRSAYKSSPPLTSRNNKNKNKTQFEFVWFHVSFLSITLAVQGEMPAELFGSLFKRPTRELPGLIGLFSLGGSQTPQLAFCASPLRLWPSGPRCGRLLVHSTSKLHRHCGAFSNHPSPCCAYTFLTS